MKIIFVIFWPEEYEEEFYEKEPISSPDDYGYCFMFCQQYRYFDGIFVSGIAKTCIEEQ